MEDSAREDVETALAAIPRVGSPRDDASLSRLVRSGLDLRGRDLGGIVLSGDYIGASQLTNVNLNASVFRDVFLRSCDLSGASIDGAVWQGVDLLAATLDDASIRGSVLTGVLGFRALRADLTGTVLGGDGFLGPVRLFGARLEHAVLLGTNLVDLTGADLTNATVVPKGADGCTWNSAVCKVDVDGRLVELPPTIWPEGMEPSRLTHDRSNPDWFHGEVRQRIRLRALEQREQRRRHGQ